ncbi:hypothetical protein ACFFNY_30000 [Paenibacillus hodogayensis]|uniref:Uncharacterized protein n=1 Tax=Paenibacillus hodogayensis TaxID=279208 RepID=A0ABV5W5I6_9BACL
MKTLTWSAELQPVVRGYKKQKKNESAITLAKQEQKSLEKALGNTNSSELDGPGNWY